MPELLRSEVLAEQPLVFVEGVRGRLRRRGRLPHGILINGVRSIHGGFAVTRDRVVGTLELRFGHASDSDTLARLPRRRVSFSMAEDVAARLFLAYRWAPGTPWR